MQKEYESWNEYAKEFNRYSKFDNNLIHTGLGLSGIEAKEIYKNSKNILDVGCGEGTNTILLKNNLSNNVIGIDIAESAIDEAKKKYSQSDCQFYISNFLEYKAKENIKFDLVTFFGSLDYIELNFDFINKLNELTNKNSRCFISKFHPFWTTLYRNDIEEESIKSYFEDGRCDDIVYGENKNFLLKRYHYSLSYIINFYKENNWKLNLLIEPEPNINNTAFSYKDYEKDAILMKRLETIPMSIIMEFERV